MLINHYTYTSRRYILKKEMYFFWRYALLFFKNGFQNRTILFYPEYPLWETEIFRIIKRLNYNITNNPQQKFDLAVYWEDTTVRHECERIQFISHFVPVLNLRCTDISKTHVEEVFRKVFGYGSFVDPARHQGLCVRKSDSNAKHDGKIIACPVTEPESGFVYQKVINHITAEGLALDYRVPIIGDAIPIVTLRYKPVQTRFTQTVQVGFAEAEAVFSPEEIRNIRRFCRKIGMDYGELDIIRDKEEGRIYILDANNTPWSPPPTVQIDPQYREMSLQRSAKAFQDNFLPVLQARPLLT